jgi:hypothetical protein
MKGFLFITKFIQLVILFYFSKWIGVRVFYYLVVEF